MLKIFPINPGAAHLVSLLHLTWGAQVTLEALPTKAGPRKALLRGAEHQGRQLQGVQGLLPVDLCFGCQGNWKKTDKWGWEMEKDKQKSQENKMSDYLRPFNEYHVFVISCILLMQKHN